MESSLLIPDSSALVAKIADALSSLGRDPIKHLVNTHWHFDRTDGNAWMHSAGATITAHDNTRKHLPTGARVEDWNFTFPPWPAGAIPTEVFNGDRPLQVCFHLNDRSRRSDPNFGHDGPPVIYKTEQNFPEFPGDPHRLDENASKTEPAKLLAVFVVDMDTKEPLLTPIHNHK